MAPPAAGGGAGFKAVASAMGGRQRPPSPAQDYEDDEGYEASSSGGGARPRRGVWLSDNFDRPQHMSAIRRGDVVRLMLHDPCFDMDCLLAQMRISTTRSSVVRMSRQQVHFRMWRVIRCTQIQFFSVLSPLQVRRLQLSGATGEEVARVLGGGVVPDSLILVRRTAARGLWRMLLWHGGVEQRA